MKLPTLQPVQHACDLLVSDINIKIVGDRQGRTHVLKIVKIAFNNHLIVDSVNPNTYITLLVRVSHQKRLREIRNQMIDPLPRFLAEIVQLGILAYTASGFFGVLFVNVSQSKR